MMIKPALKSALWFGLLALVGGVVGCFGPYGLVSIVGGLAATAGLIGAYKALRRSRHDPPPPQTATNP